MTNTEFLFRQQAFRFVLRDLAQPWRSRVWCLKQKARRVLAGFVAKLRAALDARLAVKSGASPRLATGTPPPLDRSPLAVRPSQASGRKAKP